MFFSISILLWLPLISALPTIPSTALLTSQGTSVEDIPIERTLLSRQDVNEIGRMAMAINPAYCPQKYRIQSGQPNSFINQVDINKRQRLQPLNRVAKSHFETSSIIVSSEDADYVGEKHMGGDMKWYISHTPSTQTLTLVFSSLPTTDELLELLASSPKTINGKNETLLPISNLLFPFRRLPNLSSDQEPKIFHSYIDSINSHGNLALSAILDIIDTSSSLEEGQIKKIEIIGHGLGSVVGLLVSMALKLELGSSPTKSTVDIQSNLFGLPRIGNPPFAKLVDNMMNPTSRSLSEVNQQKMISLNINRIVSHSDTITHLPGKHLGLIHHSSHSYWIEQDPKKIYYCKSNSSEETTKGCSSNVELGKTNLRDHWGPYAGIWINRYC